MKDELKRPLDFHEIFYLFISTVDSIVVPFSTVNDEMVWSVIP